MNTNSYNETLNSVLDFDLNEVNYVAQLDIIDGVKSERIKRKISRQEMLDSLFDNESGCTHEHSSELMQLVMNEYQVDMVEVSSGNGHAHNVYNDDTGEFDFYLSASTAEHENIARKGLESALIDFDGDYRNKNESVIPAYEMLDDNGELTRYDDMSSMVTVDNSDYSIWDTIAEKGALIVRHSGVWKKRKFTNDEWQAYQSLKLKKKHNRLLGLNATVTGNDTLKKVTIKRLNEACKGNKSLKRVALAAKRGQSWAIDALARIGYHGIV